MWHATNEKKTKLTPKHDTPLKWNKADAQHHWKKDGLGFMEEAERHAGARTQGREGDESNESDEGTWMRPGIEGDEGYEGLDNEGDACDEGHEGRESESGEGDECYDEREGRLTTWVLYCILYDVHLHVKTLVVIRM